MRWVRWILITTTLCSCGSEEGGGLGAVLQGLHSIPSITKVFTTSTSASASRSATPPLLKTGFATIGAVDNLFFAGLVTVINTGPAPTTLENADLFFGRVASQPAGLGACLLTQSVAQPVGAILTTGLPGCYLRKFPELESGLSYAGVSATDWYAQSTTNHTIRVTGDFGTGDSAIVTLYGTASTGESIYRMQIGVCNGSTPVQREVWEIHRVTGNISLLLEGTTISGAYRHRADAAVRLSGMELIFNPTTARTLEMAIQDGMTVTGGRIIIDGGEAISRHIAYDGSTFDDRLIGYADYTGNSTDTLRISSGAYKGVSTDGISSSTNFEGQTRYQNGIYFHLASASAAAEISSLDLSTDSFFTGFQAPSPSLSDIDCGATIGDTITFNSADPAVAAAKTECGDEAFHAFTMCYLPEVSTAKSNTWGAVRTP